MGKKTQKTHQVFLDRENCSFFWGNLRSQTV